ncbi:MAG: hypothetical protein [Bacteriophage sp.]|nr:MAG: hypothetical protein [Bacteriophage sp.]
MTNSTQIIKSVVPAITALVFRAKRNQMYMEPKTCAIASLAIYTMMTSFTRDDAVPFDALVALAGNAIERANKYNNDMKQYHYVDGATCLVGLAKHFGFIRMNEDAKIVMSDAWVELVTVKATAIPFTTPVTDETRRKPYVKGGKVKPSKLLKEAINHLEATEYHVESSMVDIVDGVLDTFAMAGRPLPDAIQQELHVWNASKSMKLEDTLFSEYFADNRGRLYHVACAGPNPQSSDFARSLYSLNVSAPVSKLDESGSLSEHYQFFMNEMEDIASGDWLSAKQLTAVATRPVKALTWMLDNPKLSPKKPFTYIRMALDWFTFETTGVCDSRIGFGLDAKCSGTQYLAFVAGDLRMARATGLVDTNVKSADPYQLSLVEAMEILRKSFKLSMTNESMETYMNPKDGRAFIKTPYMAVQYGGGVAALTGNKDFCETVTKMYGTAEKIEDFASMCVDAVHNALGEKINKFITQTQEAVSAKLELMDKAFLTYKHTDGQTVLKPCFPSEDICDAFSIRVDGTTRVIFGQEKDGKPWSIRQPNPTAEEFVRTFVVNFIQGLDALVARTVAVHAKRAGLRGFTSIHDCFRCCLADSVKLMDVIRSAYHEVFVENDQFENLSQQIGGINMYQENIVTKELLDSPHAYYFCQ